MRCADCIRVSARSLAAGKVHTVSGDGERDAIEDGVEQAQGLPGALPAFEQAQISV